MIFGDDVVRVAASRVSASGAKRADLHAAGEHRPEPVAGGAYGAEVVSVRELSHVLRVRSRAGIATIARKVRRRALHRLHRGVLLVGYALPVPGAGELAAVLAGGDGAVVSHRSAASLWGLSAVAGAEVEVTVAARNR